MIEIADLKKIRVQPGDVFVIQPEQDISAAEAHRVTAAWRDCVGSDVPLIILPRVQLIQLRPVDDSGR